MNKQRLVPPGLPDEVFYREEGVPMTKEEIRAVTLSKLRILPGDSMIDIGVGSGSVSIEAAMLSETGKVYAIEKNPKALNVLTENKKRFSLDNIEIIAGEAPEPLQELPLVDKIFIGGSGGNLEDILSICMEKLKPNGLLVVNSVTIETGPEAIRFIEKNAFTDLNIVSLNISQTRKVGRVHLWQARNPVQIITARKRSEV